MFAAVKPNLVLREVGRNLNSPAPNKSSIFLGLSERLKSVEIKNISAIILKTWRDELLARSPHLKAYIPS